MPATKLWPRLCACRWPPQTDMQNLHLILYNFLFVCFFQSTIRLLKKCNLHVMLHLMGQQIVFSSQQTWLWRWSHSGAHQLIMLALQVILHVRKFQK